MAAVTNKAVIVGGCGHVGLPLGISLAQVGVPTVLLDIDDDAVQSVRSGRLRFREEGALAPMREALSAGILEATTDPGVVSQADTVIVVIGTTVDEQLSPDPATVTEAIAALLPHLGSGQLLILRSTVFPGVTRMVERVLRDSSMDIDVAFCPERIAEGQAMLELRELPQIVASRSPSARERATILFKKLTDKIVYLEPEEAELAKLFTNTWRYIKFATANQLYMIANDYGLDFERIRGALTEDYPRAADLPGAGFAAGPCLLKDTMQLSAFHNHNFTLGQAAMMINEGLPLYVVSQLSASHELAEMTVGILGMAFKAESDDIRSSLSYKLKRILQFEGARVLCTDPYVTEDGDLLPLDQVLAEADLLIVGAPHRQYTDLDTEVPVADVWGLLGSGTRI